MRRILLGNHRAPDIMDQLRRLFALGIKAHTQVVVCPGQNDGDQLDRTIRDLGDCIPNVLSIGVVPVGLTRTPAEILAGPGASCSRILPSAANLDLRTMNRPEATLVADQVAGWQKEFQLRYGSSMVYASDEIYLLAGRSFPPARTYDEYPQYENGIGMVRDLLEDWNLTRRKLMSRSPRGRGESLSVSFVSGRMISPVLKPMIEEWSAITGTPSEHVALGNSFFGDRVTVSGLLTGRDIVANQKRLRGDVIVLPEVMLDKTGSRLLDNITPAELEGKLRKPVLFAGTMSQVEQVIKMGEAA